MRLSNTFLITGLPRIRSAWLAALLCDGLVHCVHDAVVSMDSMEGFTTYWRAMQPRAHAQPPMVVGLADPGAACIYPNEALEAFETSPIVVITRNSSASMEAYRKWLGAPITNWAAVETNYAYFCGNAHHAVHVPYGALDDFATVNRISQHCTGKILNRHRFDTFNLLKIEQHIGKAMIKMTHDRT